MKKINKTIDIDGEKIHLAKSDKIWGWRIVHPNRDENGKIVWMNLLFGGKGNLANLIILLLILSLAGYGIYEMTASCRAMAANPCKYFDKTSCISYTNISSNIDIDNLIFDDQS